MGAAGDPARAVAGVVAAGAGAAALPAFDDERLRVLVSYSSALRWQMVSAVVVIAGVAGLGGNGWGTVAAWMALALAVREWRAAWLLRLVREAHRPLAARLRTATWLTLALGAAYGGSAVFLLGMDTAHDAILTMILLSLSAGAISTTFTVPPAFVAFGAAVTLPGALAWAATGGWPGAGVAALMVMFLGVQVRFARQTLRMFEESYRMRQANSELLQQLSEERARLAQARDAAVAADLAKSRFLAAASHDLRQPLQSLALNSGALARAPLADEGREIAAEMAAGIEALRRMLDALLDISQLDGGAATPHLQPLRLEVMLQGLVRRFRKTAEAKGLVLEASCPPGLAVVSDVEMLQRVLSNLVDNALKFTAQGRVSLVAEMKVDEKPAAAGARVRLTVVDTGCGIDPAQLPHVFEDLVQLGNPQRDRARGHGLGLGIVRRLCRLLGVELKVESVPGQGTRVHLDLPAADTGAALWSDGARADPGLVARRVLVLDDDAAVRSAYASSLRSLGCEVTALSTLEEALQALPRARPEVALVDFRLAGEVNGLEAVERLRAERPGLVAVIVSADTTPELRELTARRGVPMLRKPVTDTLLALTINKLLADAGRAAPASEGARDVGT